MNQFPKPIIFEKVQKKPITEKSIGKDTSAIQAVDIQQTIEKIVNIL